MYAAYLFSVVLGGGLLMLSLLGNIFGGDASDLELEADFDIGGDVDVDVDVDFDADADADHGSASKILSMRTVTYALFGFGAVGWLLSAGGFAANAPSTIAYAATAGLASGTLVNQVFAYLKRSETGIHHPDDSFVGLAGEVTVPLGGGSVGRVAVERGARRYKLRALPHSSVEATNPPGEWRTVVVVEMKDGVAYVAPADDDLKALP